MEVRFEECDESAVERLVDWLPRERWPFHTRSRVDAAWVRERASAGYFFAPDVRSFAVVGDSVMLGLVRAFELGDGIDGTPLVDLRIAEQVRGHGVGTAALSWLTRFVFESYPETNRLGGYTRFDNLAMRRVFEKCAFVQEACHRQSWRIDGGGFADTVGYAVLRSDWSSGTLTPVRWP